MRLAERSRCHSIDTASGRVERPIRAGVRFPCASVPPHITRLAPWCSDGMRNRGPNGPTTLRCFHAFRHRTLRKRKPTARLPWALRTELTFTDDQYLTLQP